MKASTRRGNVTIWITSWMGQKSTSIDHRASSTLKRRRGKQSTSTIMLGRRPSSRRLAAAARTALPLLDRIMRTARRPHRQCASGYPSQVHHLGALAESGFGLGKPGCHPHPTGQPQCSPHPRSPKNPAPSGRAPLRSGVRLPGRLPGTRRPLPVPRCAFFPQPTARLSPRCTTEPRPQTIRRADCGSATSAVPPRPARAIRARARFPSC